MTTINLKTETIESASWSCEVDMEKLEEAFPGITLEFAKHGLKQLLADNGAGDDDKQAAADKKLAKLFEAGFRMGAGGGGGKALTPFEVEARNQVETILVNAGMKRGDAKKAATKPEAVMRAVSKRDGKPSEEAFTENWAKITQAVNKVLAERKKNQITIEL